MSNAQEIVTHETPAPAGSFLAIIESVSQNPNMNPDVIHRLIDAQERVMAKQAEMDFNEALARVSAKMPRIKKSGEVSYLDDKNKPNGPKTKAFNFARYEDIDKVVRPLLVDEGFSLSFNTAPRTGDGGGVTMIGRLSHKGGHFREASIPLALDASGGKNNIQAMGSTTSYGKRYTMCMLLNIVTEGEDDDGQGLLPIDNEKAVEIDTFLREKESKVSADNRDKVRPGFLKFMGVESIPDILAKDFDKAMNAIKAIKPGKKSEAE